MNHSPPTAPTGTNTQPTLSLQLRASLRETHDRIEKLSVAVDMIHGRLSKQTYCQVLQSSLALHSALEPRFESLEPVCQIFTGAMARAAVVSRDLSALGSPNVTSKHTSEQVAMLAEFIGDDGWRALGALYVLEGSRMGSLVLAKPLAASLGVAAELGNGLDYHLDGASETPQRFGQFKSAIDELTSSSTERTRATEGANATMAAIYQAYEELSGN